MNFLIPQIRNPLLFETTLKPAVSIYKSLDWGEAEINSPKRVVAKASIGQPYCIDLFDRSQLSGEPIEPDILAQKENFDFYFISLCCTFQPIDNCRFLWASLSVDLNAKKNATQLVNEKDKPIAWDIIPKKVVSTTAFERQSKIDSKIHFDLKVANIDANLLNEGNKQNYLVYEPKIVSNGLRSSKIKWNFISTKEEGIYGDMANLIIIARTTKGSKLIGKFSLGGEVEFTSKKGLIRSIVETTKNERALELDYEF